jgi:hypothetical protein
MPGSAPGQVPVRTISESTDPESLGRTLFTAISKNDYNTFSKYIFTREEAMQFFNKSGDGNKPNSQEANKEYDEQIKNLKEAFDELYGDEEEDLWKNAVYTKTEFTTRSENNNQTGELIIHFTSLGEDHSIGILRNFIINGRWRVVGQIKFDGMSVGRTH